MQKNLKNNKKNMLRISQWKVSNSDLAIKALEMFKNAYA